MCKETYLLISGQTLFLSHVSCNFIRLLKWEFNIKTKIENSLS